MRDYDTPSFKKSLKHFLKKTKLQDGINQVEVKKTWRILMGKTVADYTKQIYLKNGVLYISLTTSLLNEEINLSKGKIIKNMNEALKSDIIHTIIVR